MINQKQPGEALMLVRKGLHQKLGARTECYSGNQKICSGMS